MVDSVRLLAAYQKARADLLDERVREGHWIGELSTSPLSTATAVSALSVCLDHGDANDCRTLIDRGIDWLKSHQNADGGWGDTDKSYSNIATTMLVVAAFHLAGVAESCSEMLGRAERYIDEKGRVEGLRKRYGVDKTFAVPILTNCALAGLVPWREIAPLPFEAACLPQSWYRFLRLPVVSYAIPALVAIGQARYFHRKPLNPFTRFVRACSVRRSLAVLERMQPASGGYLEAVPLTSFVVMSLAGIGRVDHPVTRQGVAFLLASVREDGSWPIDTNLATWNTTLAINALAAAGEDVMPLGCLDWLLACQHRELHPFTAAEPGGWGWSDLSGAVPDADDTPGALLALAACYRSPSAAEADRSRITEAAALGIDWLLALQNRDGGWPTFCRGWGKLPFDRSGADLTAHVLRAFGAWQEMFETLRLKSAIERGFDYLARIQRPDGSWVPLWFGNQDQPGEENPVYGTAKVLAAYRDFGQLSATPAQNGFEWLRGARNDDGGWGGRPGMSSVEETALAVEILLAENGGPQPAAIQGLDWLIRAVETNEHRTESPIGFYFAKLWYYERLYPLTFTVSALGQAAKRLLPRPERKPSAAHP